MKAHGQQKSLRSMSYFVVSHATPTAMTLDEIKTETKSDSILQEVGGCIRHNTWHKIDQSRHCDILKQFKRVSSELTTSHAADIILRGTRIVILTVLQDKVIQLAHEGHQGIVKTKALLRTKVWFPDIDCRAEAAVHNCLACQANTPVTPIEPLKM